MENKLEKMQKDLEMCKAEAREIKQLLEQEVEPLKNKLIVCASFIEQKFNIFINIWNSLAEFEEDEEYEEDEFEDGKFFDFRDEMYDQIEDTAEFFKTLSDAFHNKSFIPSLVKKRQKKNFRKRWS